MAAPGKYKVVARTADTREPISATVTVHKDGEITMTAFVENADKEILQIEPPTSFDDSPDGGLIAVYDD